MCELTDVTTESTQTIVTLNGILDTSPGCEIATFWVQVLVLGVLCLSAGAVFWQLRLQTKMLRMDLLRDRITMGWLTDKPITPEHIDSVKYYPENYIPRKYRGKEKELTGKEKELTGKYLYLDQVYDYFLYVYLSSKSVKDPLGKKWQEKWIEDLAGNKIFDDIREDNRDSFRKFDDYLEGIQKKPTKAWWEFFKYE